MPRLDERRAPSVHPLIFYTATYTDERDRKFALSLGARHFIVKPTEPDKFMAIVRDILASGEQPPAGPAAPAGRHDQASEESVYLKQYNEVLIRKLESKMEQLEKLNQELEKKSRSERPGFMKPSGVWKSSTAFLSAGS